MNFKDLEKPNLLYNVIRNIFGVVILMATGPDKNSRFFLRYSTEQLSKFELQHNMLVLTDTETSTRLLNNSHVYWSSRYSKLQPSESIVATKFWDWRFRFYYLKKYYMYKIISMGKSVFQMDTDVIWRHNIIDLFNVLPQYDLILQSDNPFVNAGMMFARGGSDLAKTFLYDLSWRILLFQNHPQIASLIANSNLEPNYGNFDDQTILNDVLISTILNATVFHSTIKYEYKNKYNPTAEEYPSSFSKAFNRDIKKVKEKFNKVKHFTPWDDEYCNFMTWRQIAISPRNILGFSKESAIQHLAGIHGFAAKKKYIQKSIQ